VQNENKFDQNFSNYLCLIDFEILGQDKNGLQVIEKLNIEKNSILITGRHEEEKIRKKCNDLQIKMIPKAIAGIIPIKIQENVQCEEGKNNSLYGNRVENNSFYDAVHIDDDFFLRTGWIMSAKEKNINLLSLESPSEIEKYKDNFNIYTKFFIDKDLGKNNISGDQLASVLYQQGFREIFLSTGYEPENFSKTLHIKGIFGKMPPW
jgi:hypothetical protein